MVDHQGNIISQRYFDPFGRTASASVAGSLGDLVDTNRNRRGFTDHEHLNEQQLIHMNGRVYDYSMGRFMSVDPFIQSPTSTQSVNPYSYIMNNPLAGTDPTGYASCYEKGFLCTKDNVDKGENVNWAKACIPGSCESRSNNSNGSTQEQSSKNKETQNSDIGGLGGDCSAGK
ncbi:RHS repeat domain-containing protein [Shewanella piezotolerans]|nr:RHS repeat-associated core domain-containing protein [Shewanella piezotolerans]